MDCQGIKCCAGSYQSARATIARPHANVCQTAVDIIKYGGRSGSPQLCSMQSTDCAAHSVHFTV